MTNKTGMNVLNELKKVNQKRCEEGFGMKLSDWSLSQWSNAVAGETGELCNIIKKVERGKERSNPNYPGWTEAKQERKFTAGIFPINCVGCNDAQCEENGCVKQNQPAPESAGRNEAERDEIFEAVSDLLAKPVRITDEDPFGLIAYVDDLTDYIIQLREKDRAEIELLSDKVNTYLELLERQKLRLDKLTNENSQNQPD